MVCASYRLMCVKLVLVKQMTDVRLQHCPLAVTRLTAPQIPHIKY